MPDAQQQHMRRIRIKAPIAFSFLWVLSRFDRWTQTAKAAQLSQTRGYGTGVYGRGHYGKSSRVYIPIVER